MKLAHATIDPIDDDDDDEVADIQPEASLQTGTSLITAPWPSALAAYAAALGETQRIRQEILAENARAQSHHTRAKALPTVWRRKAMAAALVGLVLMVAELRVWDQRQAVDVVAWESMATAGTILAAAGLGTVGGRAVEGQGRTGWAVAIVAAMALFGLLLVIELGSGEWPWMLLTGASFAAAATVQSMRVVPEDERRRHLAAAAEARHNAQRLQRQFMTEIGKLDAEHEARRKTLLNGLETLKKAK